MKTSVWNDLPNDYENLPAFLEELPASGMLHPPASGIANQVIAQGFETLTDKQKHALGAAISHHMKKCVRCGERLTFGDLAMPEKGLCVVCRRQQ